MANSDPAGRTPRPAAEPAIQFLAARSADPDADLADFLPPPGSAARAATLPDLIRLDLELAAKAGRPARLEPYLRRFAADLPAAVPVGLLYEEYRARHRFGDAPGLAEYRSRFPDRYEEFRRYVELHPLDRPTPPPTGTVRPPAGDQWLDDIPAVTLADDNQPPTLSPTLSLPASPPAAASTREAADDYTLIEVLGKGAFGKVYRAEAPGGVPVAVKQLLRGIDHPAGKSELDALAAIKKLAHPFLIQVHQYWVEKDQLYIAMELAEGSLADRIAACKEQGLPGVPVEELVPFFAQAAEALDYLHSQNVSHRDVKPQNLLFLKGYAKVADFGLARTHSHQMTTVGQETGTPLFMAPEVWRRRVSLHSDQYSLAATYVAARLGRPLFEFESIVDLGTKHLEERPNLDPLPAAEQRVLLRALAKKPEDRFESCKAFVAALREATAPPPRSPAVSRRPLIIGSAVVVCGLLAAYLAFPRPTPPPPPPPPEVTWVPVGWVRSGEAEVVTDRDGRRFYRQIERPVGGTAVVARLVPATRPGDPASFYLTRDKVTNRVFAALWQEAEAGPDSALKQYRKLPWFDGELLPGAWKKGAKVPPDRWLGTDGDQLDLPVVGVTAVEADLAAAQLGGRLPTYAEWLKATGIGEDTRDSTAGGPEFDWIKLALRSQAGPWSVTRETTDESMYGIRQLVSNGLEWTRDARDGAAQLNPLLPGAGGLATNPLMRVVGETWDATNVLTFKLIPSKSRSHDWNEVPLMIGFRIALEQP